VSRGGTVAPSLLGLGSIAADMLLNGVDVDDEEDEDDEEEEEEEGVKGAATAAEAGRLRLGRGRGFLRMRAMVSMVFPKPICSHRNPPRTVGAVGATVVSSCERGLK